MHCVLAGPADGRPVVLLHGFPEFWYGMKNQIGPLASAGFRVIVPDQRGYNRSDRPVRVRDYTRTTLTADILGLLDALGLERASLVGHDWGGMVAWSTALHHPDRVERLAAIDIPHPVVFARALRRPRQLKKSWYILLFQVPRLPEYLLGKDRAAALVNLMRRGTARGALTDEDLERYRRTYTRPGAITAMLNWYRAAARYRSEPLGTRRPRMPVLVLWGERDMALGQEMARASADMCRHGRAKVYPGAGHFLQHDRWADVNADLLSFL